MNPALVNNTNATAASAAGLPTTSTPLAKNDSSYVTPQTTSQFLYKPTNTSTGNYSSTISSVMANTNLSRDALHQGIQWVTNSPAYNNNQSTDLNHTGVFHFSFDTNTTDGVPTSTPPYFLSGYSALHVALSSIIVTAIMIGIVFGNVLVIMAIAKDRNLQSIQNWFITSLAVADLLVGATVMPFSLANELMGWWYFGNVLCEVWLAVDVLLSTASILNLCLISLDRYWSITRAITYVKYRTRKRAIAMIAIVWVLSAIICFPPLVGWKRPQRKLYGYPLCELTDDIGYVLYSTLGSFYIPLVVMVVVYFKIYLAARSRARRGLKKRKAAAIGNGKSTSASTTTTSFSTPTKPGKNANKHDKELSSEEDDNCPNMDDLDSPSTDPDPQAIESIKMSKDPSGSNAPRNKAFDECRKLLSDTDVTDSGDSARPDLLSPPMDNRQMRRIHFSDTDTTSDCSYGQQSKQNTALTLPNKQDCIVENENSKPLLGDQSTESNRECDKMLTTETEEEVWVKQPQLIINNLQNDSVPQNNNDNNGLTLASSQKPEHNKCKKKVNVLNLSNLSRTGSILSKKKDNIDKEKEKEKQLAKRSVEDPDKIKRRIAKARERRATFVLGIIMAVFILCWLPFFLSYLIVSLARIDAPKILFAIFFWAGYCNSALNPVIYTIFNKDFRQAFKKLLVGKRHY